MKPFLPFWGKPGRATLPKRDSKHAARSGPVPITLDHLAILSKLQSPWARALGCSLAVPQTESRAAFKGALTTVTELELAEFVFVISRSAAESEDLLSRGRAAFSETAMGFALKQISREALAAIVADEAKLLIASVMDNAGVSQKS